jgi:glycosyltransferase involved in cell wall biosynthesis
MRILLIEPFNGGSHAAWALGYQQHSAHEIEILGLPGKNWQWRMQGAAVTLARRYREQRRQGLEFDLILASDMLDLATFAGLIRHPQVKSDSGTDLPIALYFHENQLTYPLSPKEKLKPSGRRQFGLINFTSALAADICFFNSAFHRRNFLAALAPFLQRFPDFQPEDEISEIEKKSEVLYLGLDLRRLLAAKPESPAAAADRNRPPLILWNHRWEYDKNPMEFFTLLQDLIAENIDFEVAILGEHVNPPPELFLKNRELLGDRLVHFGFAENFAEYAAWLWRADLLPVTSHHDFFGVSVIEAVYCNCFPLLPRRLAYPEHFPGPAHENFFYSDYRDLLQKLKYQLENISATRNVHPGRLVTGYDWDQMAPQYDARLSNI